MNYWQRPAGPVRLKWKSVLVQKTASKNRIEIRNEQRKQAAIAKRSALTPLPGVDVT